MNLPNKITLFRILLIPVFVLILMVPAPTPIILLGTTVTWNQILATVVFILASITDYLDGYLARKYHLVTNFGKFADPLADKMLVMTAFIYLVEMQLVPAWVVVVIVCRELAVTGLRLLLVNDGEVMAAAWLGKVKTVTQMIAITILLLNDPFKTWLHLPVGTIFLYVCLLFTVYSGLDYFIQNKHVFADSF